MRGFKVAEAVPAHYARFARGRSQIHVANSGLIVVPEL